MTKPGTVYHLNHFSMRWVFESFDSWVSMPGHRMCEKKLT